MSQLYIGVIISFHSTMSGRRLRNTVQRVVLDNGFPSNVKVVIAGLSNTYSSYVTTYEEYQVNDHSLSMYLYKIVSVPFFHK